MALKGIKGQFYYGPNRFSDHKVLVISYSASQDAVNFDLSSLKRIIPGAVQQLMPMDELLRHGRFESLNELLIFLVKTFLNMKGDLKLDVQIKAAEADGYHLIVDWDYEAVATHATNLALFLISFLSESDQISEQEAFKRFNTMIDSLMFSLPFEIVQVMNQRARKRNIPFYYAGMSSQVFLYGQGINGIIYNHASNSNDSLFGYFLAKDKMQASSFLSSLGFPVTTQKVVGTLQDCKNAVEEIGFPAVIKPLSGKGGKGVTTNIQSFEEVADAFELAMRDSDGKILVENYAEGQIYRITITQGKLNSLYLMNPAHVMGDGRSSILQLIQNVNQKREEDRKQGMRFKNLAIDDAAMKVMSQQGFTPNSIPKDGERVNLRTVGNRASGGTFERLPFEQMHPDVHEMMLTMFKAFKIDNLGVDYISDDISRSWRETGTIIEVNPFISVDNILADNIFASQFPENKDARIKTILYVSDEQHKALEHYEGLLETESGVGFVSHDKTLFGGGDMHMPEDTIYKHCVGMFLNPTCSCLMVHLSAEDITAEGLPIDCFDHCYIDQGSTSENDEIKSWLEKYVGSVHVH